MACQPKDKLILKYPAWNPVSIGDSHRITSARRELRRSKDGGCGCGGGALSSSIAISISELEDFWVSISRNGGERRRREERDMKTSEENA